MLSQVFLQQSLFLLLEEAQANPSRQLLILTPNDYHGTLRSPRCQPLYAQILKEDADGIVIKHMPDVARSHA